MKMTVKAKCLFTIITISLLLAACAPAEPTAAPTLPPTSTALPTRQPTSTPLPTATQTPIPSKTPTQTITPLPTPRDQANEARLFAQGKMTRYDYFLTIQFPESIEGSYYAKVDKNKFYTCNPISDQKNRLLCLGQLPGVDKNFNFVLYDAETDLEVFSTQFFVPLDLN
jgi:hypothetical protein